MLKISITKNGQVTHSASFDTQAELDQWLSRHEGMKTFGEKEVWGEEQILVSPEVRGPLDELVKAAVYDSEGNEVEPALYVHHDNAIITPAVYETRPVIVQPAEYEVVITDITAKLTQDKINDTALKLLAETDWLIVRELETGVVCPPEIKQARAIARASIIR